MSKEHKNVVNLPENWNYITLLATLHRVRQMEDGVHLNLPYSMHIITSEEAMLQQIEEFIKDNSGKISAMNFIPNKDGEYNFQQLREDIWSYFGNNRIAISPVHLLPERYQPRGEADEQKVPEAGEKTPPSPLSRASSGRSEGAPHL